MRQGLKLHPDSRCSAVTRIEVEIELPRPDRLILSYAVTGKIGDIRLPPVGVSARGDKLWRHTCFEAFVRASSGAGYYEFNFAPSTEWAVYRFSGYRSGLSIVSEIGPPAIEVQAQSDRTTLRATVALDRLADLPRHVPWRLGLSAVIEDVNGGMSYWALAHPPGKPDFHHADGFAYELAPAMHP